MSTIVGLPPLHPVAPATPPINDEMREQVWNILSGLYPRGKSAERRLDQRFPYPRLLYLTPLGNNGLTPVADSVVVVGKDLSERGLGFFYQQPLAYRRMIASLELPEARWAGFLVDITWCRFTLHGWYDSGGRFLQPVPSPITRRAG